MKLRAGERCPIHHGYYCCGRVKTKPSFQRKGPVTKTPDGRELCTPAELRRRLLTKLERQKGICAICHEPITDIQEAVLDHKEPRGMGGAFRDDSWGNIQAAHSRCNLEKGSIRNYQPPDRKLAASGEREDAIDL